MQISDLSNSFDCYICVISYYFVYWINGRMVGSFFLWKICKEIDELKEE
jgi:hypothetical protein